MSPAPAWASRSSRRWPRRTGGGWSSAKGRARWAKWARACAWRSSCRGRSLPHMSLADLLQPCGPVVDAKAAERLRSVVAEAGWTPALEQAWPAMAPVFAASPYLANLVRRDPGRLAAMLQDTPEARLTSILTR